MKKLIIFIYILITTFLCFAFSRPTKNTQELNVITGIIKVYGNDPFIFIGIETDEKKQYTIQAEDNVLKKLKNAQGEKINIKGIIENSEEKSFHKLKDGYLIVYDWDFVK